MKRVSNILIVALLLSLSILTTSCAAKFELSSFDVLPSVCLPGETTTASVTVSNTGNAKGDCTIELLVDGIAEQTQTLTLEPGASEPVSFTFKKDQPGEYVVQVGEMMASFIVLGVSNLKVLPSEVEPDQPVTITADLQNVTETQVDYHCYLFCQGKELNAKDITVAGNSTEEVTFTLSQATSGTYKVELLGLSGSFKVLKPLAQEIVDRVIESLDNIRTCQFDMDMTMDMAGEVEGESFEMATVMDYSGASDIENRQMRMDMTISMTIPGELEQEMGMEVYLIGEMIYTLMEIPEIGPMWMKMEMPVGTWEQMSLVDTQVELLEAAQVEVIGSESIGGIDCYVLQLTPDVEQLWQMAMEQAQLGAEMPVLAEELIEEMCRSSSVKQWIAKDTYFITKVETGMVVELTPEAMGLPGVEGVVTMDIAIVGLHYNHNQPVSIVLPPEAEEAIEVPME